MNAPVEAPPAIVFYVSPDGDDRWPGKLADPNAARTDGPFKTIEHARDAVRQAQTGAGAAGLPGGVRVVLRGGTYELDAPLVFSPEDSGAPAPADEWQLVTGPPRHVTYAAAPGESPVISGGRRITGWQVTTINDRPAWIATLPDVAAGKWNFTQLWVDGRRAPRTRLPKEGTFRIEKLIVDDPPATNPGAFAQFFTGHDHFRFAAGDLQAWKNVGDIEFVALHFWIESRIPLKSVDPATREARLQWKTRMSLTDNHGDAGAPYYVENVYEELKDPGQWYLDRAAGKLYYLPLRGQEINKTEIIAPRVTQVVILQGNRANQKPVKHIAFEGVTFSHNEWVAGDEAKTATPQAACHVPGAVAFRFAQSCEVRNCTLTHLGSYAAEISDASSDVSIVRSTITDLAGGGVKIWHAHEPDPGTNPTVAADQRFLAESRRNLISDNEISDGGHRWRQAVGVLVGMCSGNQIVHNHIHDFDYSGVSVGWIWGYAESHGVGNIIEHNHIHDIGRGVLSDMGAIYLLGIAPGTRVRYNHIHDVNSRGYGGWGIYLDEGSSNVVVENNLVHRTKSQGYHQHYGRENIIRNNIFALGREGGLARSRLEPHSSFTFERNIVYGDGGAPIVGGDWNKLNAVVDNNLYFDAKSGQDLRFGGGKTLAQWQELGADRESVIANPLFVDPAKADFHLRPDSPAGKIGFVPFETNAGPRKSR